MSTAPVRQAAEQFLAALTAEQRARTLFPVDDPEWRKWMNQHFYVRQGVSFLELSDAQREAAFGLLRASLSARGLQLTRDIMRLNETLAELTGDQVVMTPHFAGSEPALATSGTYQGTVVLQEEQDQGLALVQGLSDAHQKKAVLDVSKTGNNNLTEAFKDNLVLDYAGVCIAELSASQRRQLIDLVQLYVGHMDEGHAQVKMAEVTRHLDHTWFAWIGQTAANGVFYYRIHSPVILIEFDHQRPANLARVAADPKQPTRQHIHVVVRTPNGNDYGKDLLRQHYLSHRHHH